MQLELIPPRILDTNAFAKGSIEPLHDSTAMRVLMIVESSAGGTGRHVLDLSEGLVDRGFEIHILFSTLRADQKFLDRIHRMKGVSHATIDMRTGLHPSDLTAAMKVRRYLKDHGPFDAIHGHSSKGGAIARMASFGSGVPAFYTLHGFIGLDTNLSPIKRTLYVSAERLLSRMTARIIAVSPEEARASVKNGLGRERVVVVPNGLPPLRLASRAEARDAIGVSEATPVIGFVGRFVSQKAPHVLLQAFANAVPEIPEARLAMVGSGPLATDLHAAAVQLEINDRVIWLGERDVGDLLSGFDCFALPSMKEGLPYVALEAMAAGLPIVATETSGVEILVTTGINGVVIPPGDTRAMALALTKLVSDHVLRARFGRASLERSSRFTLDMMVDRTIEAYESSRIGSPPPAPPSVFIAPAESMAITSVCHDVALTKPSIPEEKPMNSKPRSAELHPGPGFRISTHVAALDPSLIDRFRDFDTPDISDLLNRLYAVDPTIHCLTGPGHSICGPACTVKVFPGDNLMVHKSLDIARPGDVVVVDAGGSRTNAVLGDLISAKAKHRKIQGFVVDGLVRDLPAIEELDFPVYARGTTPIGPLHRGPGEINYPVCCGGIVVNPGDLVVADAAGVIIVPRGIAGELILRLEKHRASNKAYFEAVRRGEFSNAWVDVVLENQGYVSNASPESRNGFSEPAEVASTAIAATENCSQPAVI